MKKILIVFCSILLIIGCSSPFEKEFEKLKPLELVDALNSIDTISSCKKKWISNNTIQYHASEKDLNSFINTDDNIPRDYKRETLTEVYKSFSEEYDRLVSKWQNHYDMNEKLKSVIQIDTAYLDYDRQGDLKIYIKFMSEQEIERASFFLTYRFPYNFKNGVSPDRWVSDRCSSEIDGDIFNGELKTIWHRPHKSFIEDYKSIGSKNKIKGKKPDEYEIDYTTARIYLKNDELLTYTDMNKMPKDICLLDRDKAK